MIGRTISHYKITDKLGEGGMGVVYKAEDIKLKRPVAVKFLAPHLLRDEEGRKRFQREAMAAAALDHPNVCTVYEIDEADDRTFIVMAFLEGRTLSQKIGDGPLKLPEALSIAIQMADGLEAAHEKGVVHRDIKPDNVMLMKGSRGLVKLMDFGLAQLAESSKLTREGTTLGTPIYMSPEQALGESTDERSDVWALGVVLYEMVAGRPPFQGEVDQAVIYAIANEQHEPLTGVRTGVPKDLERIVDKCLAKEASERYQHVTDLLVDLQACRRALEPGAHKAVPAAAPVRRMSPAAWGIATAVIVAVAVTAWWFGGIGVNQAPPTEYSLRQLTQDTGLTHQPAISKDGSMIAYASDRAGESNLDIWVQHVAGGQPSNLTKHEATDEWPDFSPDGSQVVFQSDRDGGGIFVAPTLGGEARPLAPRGRHPRVSPDGRWVAYADSSARRWGKSAIQIVAMSGGSARTLETGTAWASYPVWSPDGSNILFVGSPEEVLSNVDTEDWWVVPTEGGQAVKTGARKALEEAGLGWPNLGISHSSHWLGEPDRMIFSFPSGGTPHVFQLRLSPETWEPAGLPERLTQAFSETQPAVAPDGRIAFAASTKNFDIWSVGFDPKRAEKTDEPTPLLTSAASEYQPTVSFDGRKMVFNRRQSGSPDIFVWDTVTERETPLVLTPEQHEIRALISPDGKIVAFERGRYGNLELIVIPTAGGQERKLADVSTLTSWAWDSRRVVCLLEDGRQWSTIDVVTGEAAPLVARTGGDVSVPTLSPDGKWLSLMLQEGPLVQSTYIAPIREGGAAPRSEWIRLTSDQQDGRSWWGPDGEMLYFTSNKDGFMCLWVQRLHPQTKQPLGKLEPVLEFHDPSRSLNDWILGMAADRLYLQLLENTGNIWLAGPVTAP